MLPSAIGTVFAQSATRLQTVPSLTQNATTQQTLHPAEKGPAKKKKVGISHKAVSDAPPPAPPYCFNNWHLVFETGH